jgi:hypothetical protein
MQFLNSFKGQLKVASICLGLLVPASGAYAAGGWDFEVIPYLWAAGISLDAKINDQELIEEDVAFDDLLDKTDFAFAFHFEGGKGKGGFLFDFFGIKGSDTTGPSLPSVPILPEISLETELDAMILEGGGYYRPGGSEGSWDIIFGVRYIDVEQKLTLNVDFPIQPPFEVPPELGGSETLSSSFTDGFVGGRFKKAFANKWAFAVRGDVGGGDTDLSWSAYGAFSYTFDQKGRYKLRFGYKHFAMELEQKQGPLTLKSDISFSGPIVGFVIGF